MIISRSIIAGSKVKGGMVTRPLVVVKAVSEHLRKAHSIMKSRYRSHEGNRQCEAKGEQG